MSFLSLGLHITSKLCHTLHWLPVTARIVWDSCFDLRLCPRYWSCLPQESHLPILKLVMSVTPFGWPRRPICFVGKHVHRPAKFHHLEVSSHLEMHFHLISAHRTTVADSSDLSWKHIFSDKPGVTINHTELHRATPDRIGPIPGRKWLIISLRRLLRVEFRHNSEPTVLGLQLNKQETLNASVTNSPRASTRVHFFGQLRIISSSYAF